jgi:hypothetical protein
MKPEVYFKPGDVIVCDRIFYQHFGIYVGKGWVIHYASKNGDFGSDIQVRETGLKQFANGRKCEAVLFPRRNASPKRFSPQETVKRTQSRLGEKSYNLREPAGCQSLIFLHFPRFIAKQ